MHMPRLLKQRYGASWTPVWPQHPLLTQLLADAVRHVAIEACRRKKALPPYAPPLMAFWCAASRVGQQTGEDPCTCSHAPGCGLPPAWRKGCSCTPARKMRTCRPHLAFSSDTQSAPIIPWV